MINRTTPTGTISMDDVRTELKVTGTITLNDTNVRKLAGKTSGEISMNDLRGKSNGLIFTPVYDKPSGTTTYWWASKDQPNFSNVGEIINPTFFRNDIKVVGVGVYKGIGSQETALYYIGPIIKTISLELVGVGSITLNYKGESGGRKLATLHQSSNATIYNYIKNNVGKEMVFALKNIT